MTTTRNRVPSHTDEAVNRRIARATEQRVRYYARHRSQIDSRLQELEEEWDIERAIEANASALAFTGVALALLSGRRRWLMLSATVTGFLFQHAVQGWCPPIPILRRLGFRTSYEIEQERQALKVLRGDFDGIRGAQDNPQAALNAARA